MTQGKTIRVAILSLLLAIGSWQLWPEVRNWWPRPIADDELLIPVCRADRWGYIDQDGQERLPFVWGHAETFDVRGAARVTLNFHGCTWIDRQGRHVNEPPWAYASYYLDTEGWSVFTNHDGKKGWIDRKDQVVIEPTWDDASDFGSAGWALVQRDEKWGWIDRQGQIVLERNWEDAKDFDKSGWAQVCLNGKWGWINRQGQAVLEPQWEDARNFDKTGWASVQRDGRWGWIDRQGQVVLKLQWEDVRNFDSSGWARVRLNGKWGWIDLRGQIVLEPKWNEARNFDASGVAAVRRGLKWGSIDRRGQIVVEPQWGVEPVVVEHQGRRWYVFSAENLSPLNWLRDILPVWIPWPGFDDDLLESACYDSTGRLIWSSEDRLTRRFIAGLCGAILALYALYEGIHRVRSLRRTPTASAHKLGDPATRSFL